MLSAINAATARSVISATMAHLLVCNGGTRLICSHGFGSLLVGQLVATREERPVDVQIRVNTFKREQKYWQDNSSHDCIHRPSTPRFRRLCAYKMVMLFKKTYKPKREVAILSRSITSNNKDAPEDNCRSDSEEEEVKDLDSDIDEYASSNGQGYKKKKFTFSETRPGKQFSHPAVLKKSHS